MAPYVVSFINTAIEALCIAMGTVELSEVTKIFTGDDQDIVAVDNLDIDIKDGEFLVLVGPSGCGKSTTLRCLAGLEQVTSGDIYIDGEDMTGKRPRERNIAMVFQSYALYPHMTVRKNMAFGLKMSTESSKEEINERVEESAQMMGIEDLLEQKPKELSGGQQQRVALGRAIVRDPSVFLMDEPLSNLDAKLRTKMRTELQNLQQNLDVTTIYVTHDQTEAMTMADRIAILNGGVLQQVGPPIECYHQPVNQFVAGFIGSPSMNFVDVTLENNGKTTVLTGNGITYSLSSDLSRTLRNSNVDIDQNLTLGIRPEDIKLASRKEKNAITTTVSVTEPVGDSTYVYFDINDEQYTATLDGNLAIDTDDTINILFPEDHIHIFDANTGQTVLNRQASIRREPSEGLITADHSDTTDIVN